MAPSIRAREIDGLPKASMAKLLVTKQDPNPCDRVGKKSMPLNYRNIVDGRYIAIHAVDSEVKSGLKSNSVRSGQPTYEACDDNLDARIKVAPIKFILSHVTCSCQEHILVSTNVYQMIHEMIVGYS